MRKAYPSITAYLISSKHFGINMVNFGHGVRLSTLGKLSEVGRIRSWRNDHRIWKWCRQNDILTHAAHDAWFNRIEHDPTIKMYSILTIEDELVGVCGLTSIDMLNRRAEFSLYIDPNLHGRGIGTRALQTLVSHGMSNIGLNSIWGESFEGNPAVRMFQNLGFKHEGIRREAYFREGKFIDAHLYSILFSDWKAKSQFGKVQQWN